MKGAIGNHARGIDRRAVVSGAAATALVLATGRARAAADFRYKFATNLPLTHPLNIRLQQAFDRIKKDSNGALELELFPNSQLGGDTDVLSQLRSGGVEFFSLSTVILSTLVPIASISGIGFAMPDYDTVWRAMDGELGTRIRHDIIKADLIAMDRIWDNGFRHITTSSKPIRSPDDLRDVKMRVPVSPLWTSMFRAFGAGPVSINASEIYSALNTKIADGEENPLTPIWSLKLYEVQRYLALTGHMWDGYWVLANHAAWQALPEDLRNMVAWHSIKARSISAPISPASTPACAPSSRRRACSSTTSTRINSANACGKPASTRNGVIATAPSPGACSRSTREISPRAFSSESLPRT